MEYSISLSTIRQSSETEVNGPTYAPLITDRAPMITGPTMRLPLTLAPASIRTRPMISLPSSTSASSWDGSMVSRTVRLTSSMSVTLPVSFQYPRIVVERTSRFWSISHWMAWVISSSPRQEGSIERTASWMAGVKR